MDPQADRGPYLFRQKLVITHNQKSFPDASNGRIPSSPPRVCPATGSAGATPSFRAQTTQRRQRHLIFRYCERSSIQTKRLFDGLRSAVPEYWHWSQLPDLPLTPELAPPLFS